MSSANLSEILTYEGDTLTDISLKITGLVQKINMFKNEMKALVDDGDMNFRPFGKERIQLKTKAETLIEDMTMTQQYINSEIKPELSSCSIELKSLSRSLQEVNLSLFFLDQLVVIYNLLKNAKNEMKNHQFYESAKLTKQLRELIKDHASHLKHLLLFKTLEEEAVISYEYLLHQVNDIWSSHIVFQVTEKEDGLKQVILSIDTNSKSEMCDILKALDCLEYTVVEKKFIDTFLISIVYNIILKKTIITENIDKRADLTLEIMKAEEKPYYTEVFLNLGVAIRFLKSHLNIDMQNGTSFLKKIGTRIGNQLAEKLIKDCLTETIPTTLEDLEKYKNIIETAEELELLLKDCEFLPYNSKCLIDYAKNINVLFANKCCQTYLEKARILMKNDLHNVTETEETVISNISLLPRSYRNILKNKLNIHEDELTVPKSKISKSAEEVISLVKKMISELLRSQDLYAVRLFYTVRNIFEMYSAIVPLHHKKFLDTLPQQVALFHNNCLYFMHFLIYITCEYYKKIPSILNDHFNIFLEEAVSLRTVAKEKFEQHVTTQKTQFLCILRDSGLTTLNEEQDLNPHTEKSIRQCIRQLQLLNSVWKDVLPLKVYNRAMGYLLDSIIDEIISLVMDVEDISSQTASDLASVFDIVVDRAPVLFSDGKEIFRHSKNWLKLKEFIVILKGSLRDIDERWSNGMGPLANEFTPDEVKHLIRALFQNSERRSALLNKVK